MSQLLVLEFKLVVSKDKCNKKSSPGHVHLGHLEVHHLDVGVVHIKISIKSYIVYGATARNR